MTPPASDGPRPAGDRLGEFDRIDRFFRPLAAGNPASLGLTDDAALLALAPDRELVVTTDALVEGVHFLPGDPPADVAVKALGVNVSDLAAMAADPLGYTLALAMPRGCDDAWLEAFAGGLAEAQRLFAIALLGGDSVATPGPLVISVTAMGTVPKGRALRRGTARAGDAVFVTGTFGDAALGLLVLQGRLDPGPAAAAELADRYRRPRPRLAAVPLLRAVASAGLDVSDGLVADLGHLCAASGLAAEIAMERVPLSAAARAAVGLRPDLRTLPLVGGDDYEIVFTADAAREGEIAALARDAGVDVTRIGGMVEAGSAAGVRVLDPSGAPVPLAGRGWVHFQDG
ncbi:thiamine-phosphate kinase [Arenibaculum sp.]|uniref:thiamine-phosphate kinase n=1 Tax=Arenibaculum sp. TaxID=2865862 RepID=UPI002E162160|nr:thiamine-phosphate kinase [Arenibaculum sp.]